jgi:hypothetical protein
MFVFRSPGFLTVVLPLVSGAASYVLSAWIAGADGDACVLSGPGTAGFLLLIVVPAIVVGYRAIVTRKSRLATIALIVVTAALTVVAVLFAGLVWAGVHACFG